MSFYVTQNLFKLIDKITANKISLFVRNLCPYLLELTIIFSLIRLSVFNGILNLYQPILSKRGAMNKKIKLMKQICGDISDDEAIAAYERLVRLFVILYECSEENKANE